MANNALALSVATPAIDPVGAFEVGQQAGQQQAMAKLQQAEAGLKHLGSLAFGALGGKLDGQVDPAIWDQVVSTLGPEGEKYKGRPDLAPILAKASADTLGQLQIAQNERELDMRLEEFQFNMDQAAAKAAAPMLINDQLVDPGSLEVRGDYRDKGLPQGDAPSGYQFAADGSLVPIPGGPADPNNPMNKRRVGQGPMSPTTQKELFEADEGVMAAEGVITALDKAMTLNETAWDGPLADVGTQAGALVGDANSVDTQELKNLVTAQALEQLKAVFGAMPTEGERKILLEIQGSVTQSRAVRKRIFERAKAAVERRLKFNREKAEGLRSGSYFEEGFGADEAGGNTTSTGVTWSIE